MKSIEQFVVTAKAFAADAPATVKKAADVADEAAVDEAAAEASAESAAEKAADEEAEAGE